MYKLKHYEPKYCEDYICGWKKAYLDYVRNPIEGTTFTDVMRNKYSDLRNCINCDGLGNLEEILK